MKKFFCLFFISTIVLFASAQNSLNIGLVGSYSYPNSQGSDIWAYVDQAGIEYALVGLNNGFSVVDLSNPSNPIENFFISGQQSSWRDIKVWNNYAFITCDQGCTNGLLIVDLNDMSGNTFVYTTIDQNGQNMFSRAHNIYIDEYGKAYIFGGDVGSQGGALILDVTSVDLTPGNVILPTIIGLFDDFYLHDGMARGDTLWGAAVYQGNFYAIDVSSPSNPTILNNGLAFHPTPNNFTHNCWISDDGNTLFTTDEVSGAYIASYDVSNLNNIYEIDRIQSNSGSGSIPHNTHVLNNFIVSSYYRDGIRIHDVTYPDNIIEVGYYDAYLGNGDGDDGCWGAYPWLPSGIILSSEINSGANNEGMLLVLEPSFQQACYLEGNVYDFNGQPIIGANIEILSTTSSTNTNLNGYYSTGCLNNGSYQVVFSASGYLSDTLIANLQNGSLTVLNATLFHPILGCNDPSSTNYNPNANVSTCFGGVLDNTFSSGGFFYGNQHLLIDVYEECVIKSAFFEAEDYNTITFELRDSNGIVIDDTTHNVSPGMQQLLLNFNCPVGTNFQLGTSANNTGLFRNDDGANYPYNIGDALSIVESSAGVPGYYYYYYNIEVTISCDTENTWDCVLGECVSAGGVNGEFLSENDCLEFCSLNSLTEIYNNTIFPNPTNTNINFISNYMGEINVKNILGKIIFTINKVEDVIKVNLNQYPDGIYFLETPEEKFKIIKQ